MSLPSIFFHVGLGKTGSTYLQYHFFPKLQGVRYIQRTRYKQYRQIIEGSQDEKLLFSREFDRQLEEEVEKFAHHFPETHAVLILRPPESWAASQYRRFVKNGFSGSFTDFIDVKGNNGFWDRDELLFSKKIRALEQHFGPDPLILPYQELKESPYRFFDRIAAYIGASYDREAIDLSPSHRSYNERQLKLMRKVAGKLALEPEPKRSRFKALKWLQEWGRRSISYSLLYGSHLLPESSIPKEPLIRDEELEKVRSYCAEDYRYCLERAKA